jgi:hypothetical protein
MFLVPEDSSCFMSSSELPTSWLGRPLGVEGVCDRADFL